MRSFFTKKSKNARFKKPENVKLGLLVVATLMLLTLTACSLGRSDLSGTNPGTNPSTDAPPATDTTASSTTFETETTLPTQSTQPTESSAPTESTAPTQATQPTVPTQPTTPSNPSGLYYTREELEQMDNTNYGYGPGNFPGRPQYAVDNQKLYGKYAANFIAPDNGNIYLTFDCGYEHYVEIDGKKVSVTSMILDTLKEKDVKAVFFVTWGFIKYEPDLVQRIIDEGHTLGNHTNQHPVMPTVSIDRMEREVMSVHDYIKEHYDYTMTLFRPPTGAFSVRSLAVVQNLGYKNVFWSFAYEDWDPEKQPDPEAALNKILNKAHSGAIYLLHNVSYTNATVLGDAIDGFRDMGYNIALFE